MKTFEIREIFFSFFEKKNHYKVLSSPLIPAKDPTLLFTNSGMNQFKSVFLQDEKREYKRAVSIQKCMRVSGKHNDFDEVGKTEYHHTFFEMMGNFSFGDYFKEQSIEYAWELLTENYKLKPEELWISVHEKDEDTFKIWEQHIGIPTHKIIKLGDKYNFWQMGETGPCGPCSEIHFDRGEIYGPAYLTENNNRFIEVWNLVFMQYYKDKKGKLNPLPAPSIDTGMGIERLTSILQGLDSNYKTDLFKPIIEFTSDLANINPDEKEHQINLKIIADHTRALCFLISDGILPSNDGRGYVLRRILRRAAKHGKALGFSDTFIYKISAKVVDLMKNFYPELEYNRDFISQVILSEEERFNRTLLNGLEKFEELLNKAVENKENIIHGKELFKLSDTFGFPLDFAKDLANEKEVKIDYNSFQQELKKQKEQSKTNLIKKQKSIQILENINKYRTEFTGYKNFEEEATLLSIYKNNKEISSIKENQKAILVFDKTPFYAESGGQIGDTGIGKNDNSYLIISDTQKIDFGKSGAFLHFSKIKKGELKPGDKIILKIDRNRRQKIRVHHSSTHLLHSGLREVLGLHIKQAGSHVDHNKLRFDFTHFKSLKQEEIEKVENFVNQKVRENIIIKSEILKYEEAIEKGAIAIFEEKYSDTVRLILIGSCSKELCAGTHLNSTGEIGVFKILSESSTSSGVRRIEAVAGEPGFNYIQKNLNTFNDIQLHFKQKQSTIFEFLMSLDKNLKQKEKQLKTSNKSNGKINIDKITDNCSYIDNIKVVIEYFENLEKKQLNSLADEIKNTTHGVSILLSNINGKSYIIMSVFKDLTNIINSNNIVKEIAKLVNGNGGGRPDFAQAGGNPIKNFKTTKKGILDILNRYIK